VLLSDISHSLMWCRCKAVGGEQVLRAWLKEQVHLVLLHADISHSLMWCRCKAIGGEQALRAWLKEQEHLWYSASC
jgi:hypothetical protein